MYDPLNNGLYLNSENKVVCLGADALSNTDEKLTRLEVLNVMDISGGAYFELIDSKALQRHLLQEAYERQVMLENENGRTL